MVNTSALGIIIERVVILHFDTWIGKIAPPDVVKERNSLGGLPTSMSHYTLQRHDLSVSNTLLSWPCLMVSTFLAWPNLTSQQ